MNLAEPVIVVSTERRPAAARRGLPPARLRVAPRERAVELARYLAGGGCPVSVDAPHGLVLVADGNDRRFGALRLEGYLRAWRARHPEVEVETPVSAPSRRGAPCARPA